MEEQMMSKNGIFQMCLQTFSLLILLQGVTIAQQPGIPDGWSDGYVYANGIRIHYYHATPQPDKPVIVMVHGVTDIGLNWAPLTLALEGSYDIYMLDARGHGLTDPFTPSDDGDTLVKDVVEFVNVMGFEKPILMGHSMGAATVMRTGAEYPDLSQAVVMLDPGLRPRPPRPAPATSSESEEDSGQDAPPPQREAPAPDRLSLSMFGAPEVLVAQNNYNFDDLVATCQRQSPKWSLTSCEYWALSKKQYHGAYSSDTWQAMSGTMQTGNSLVEIQVPAFILKADAPAESREADEEAVSAMPNGKVVHIDGGGHNLHHDEPERSVEALTDFLSTL